MQSNKDSSGFRPRVALTDIVGCPCQIRKVVVSFDENSEAQLKDTVL